jgi:uncharacterized protein YegJ (DUF2314 family)
MPKALSILAWLALILLLGHFAAPAAHAQDSSYIKIPNADPAMEAAKAQARATLPQFWQKFAAPGPNEDGFGLKVALPYGNNNTEHIWTRDIERKDGKISGVINNVPRDVKTVRLGQRIEISEGQISDWMYMRDGKIVGNYTMRPLLARMPPADAARYRAMLAEP